MKSEITKELVEDINRESGVLTLSESWDVEPWGYVRSAQLCGITKTTPHQECRCINDTCAYDNIPASGDLDDICELDIKSVHFSS